MLDVFVEFKKSVQSIFEIMECYMVVGGFDYLVKLWVKDMNVYCEFLGKLLLQLKGVCEIYIYVVMEEVKNIICLFIC